jgi:hypothetical protein
MSINWDQEFTLTVPLSPPLPTIIIDAPTYGNYGGLNYSNGEFVHNTAPVDYNPTTAVDVLDLQFLIHDEESAAARVAGAVDPIAGLSLQADADKTLIDSLVALTPDQLDAEASVYAGAATLAHIALLEINPVGVDLSFGETLVAATDAYENIERGYANLDAEDRQAADEWLQEVWQTPAVQVVAADFSF